MVVKPKNISFTKISQLIESIDITGGTLLLWDSTKKKTIKEYILQSTLPRLLFMFTFSTISTLFVTHFELISIILCTSLASSIFGICTIMTIVVSKRIVIKNLLNWCKSLYDVKKKYHESIQNLAKTNLVTIERQTSRFLRFFRVILYVDAIGFTIGFAIIGFFLPENIYPKYSPPTPFYLPFKNQKTWLAFGFNTAIETIIAIDTATITIFMFSIGITIFIHILGYLDTIQLAVEQMKQDIEINVKNEAFKAKEMQNTISFEEWIKVLNEMISEVNSVITKAEKLYNIPFFLNELAALGSLFICGLLLTVVRQQYFYAIGMTIVCWLYFSLCFVNEKIIEKFENINDAFYDIPWYNLTVKQRKSLMMLMHCDKIQKGLTAIGIHSLTMERFGIIVKAGYTNMLVLKDLVQK